MTTPINTYLFQARQEVRTQLGTDYWPKIKPIMDSVEAYMASNHKTLMQAFARLVENPNLTPMEKRILASAVVELGEVEL